MSIIPVRQNPYAQAYAQASVANTGARTGISDFDVSYASKHTHQVYLKSDDMLYSGGNGTGLSFYIKYADNSTAENPIVTARGINENGQEFEQTICIKSINPNNATIVEMRALEAHISADKGVGISSLPMPAGSMGLSDRRSFFDMFKGTINELSMLREHNKSNFYLNNMRLYYDFFGRI